MPTYQYRCTDCGRDLEVVQKFTDASLTECPTCAGQLRKVFNAVGVVFKGSGFYRTDSRAANGGGEKSESSNGEKKSDSGEKKTEKSTDAQPAKTDAAKSDSTSKPDKVSASSSSTSSTGAKAAAS